MNNIFKKVLSAVEEFANSSNRLSLAADSILDRIVPKGTARAGCWKYRNIYDFCGSCSSFPGRWVYQQKAFCDTPPGHTCSDPNVHCGPWTTYNQWCQVC